MTYTNHSPTKAAPPAKPIDKASPKGISESELRRSTYTPGRPAGVHARELGLKRS